MLAIISLFAAGGVGWLGYQGWEIAQRIKGGQTIKSITDPTKPGFLAATVPTPVHLLAITDGEDVPVDFVLLIEGPGGVGGSVVWIVGDVVVGEGEGRVTLVQRFTDEGIAAVKRAIEVVVGFGITDTSFVGPDEWATLVGTTGALRAENPDPLVRRDGSKRTTVYAAGSLKLDPEDVGDYVTFLSDGAAASTRGTQAEALWSAYFAALADMDEGDRVAAAPVAADSGVDLAASTASMASGDVTFVVLPVNDEPFGPTRIYSPDQARAAEVLRGLVAAPVSAFPGQRRRVEILNGTSDLEAAARVAPEVAAAGAEVTAVGNAKSFTHATTTVEFHVPEAADAAAAIAALFGVTATASPDQSDARDITVTLGSDLTK